MREGLLKYKCIKNTNSDKRLRKNRISASNLNGENSAEVSKM